MTNFDEETDEDKQIARLQVHRDLIGWIIKELDKQGIKAVRTHGSNPKGDILIIDSKQIGRVKEIMRQIHRRFNS